MLKKLMCVLLVLCLTGCQNTKEQNNYKYTEKEAIEYTIEKVKNEYPYINEIVYLGIDEDKSMICFKATYDEEFSTEYEAYIITHLLDGALFITEAPINTRVETYYEIFN